MTGNAVIKYYVNLDNNSITKVKAAYISKIKRWRSIGKYESFGSRQLIATFDKAKVKLRKHLDKKILKLEAAKDQIDEQLMFLNITLNDLNSMEEAHVEFRN